MDRQTRRANFKNLQQASNKLRSTRSTAALSLSDFFSTPEETPQNPPAAAPAASVEIAPPSPKIKPIRAGNVFEKPGPKPKKAPKLKASSSTSSTSNNRRGRGRSKQQPSISNFMRNEQMFAEVTAQHCMADNFSPDDIEMALALSKSEAEKRGCLRLNDDDDKEEDVVDLLDNSVESTENIRRKLQKYGFRTAAKEDYRSLAILPVVAGKGSRRGKWANKFTALTLRNAEVQQKKLVEKVSTLMAQQVRTKEPQGEDLLMMLPYKPISSNLQSLRAPRKSQILHEPHEGAVADLSLFYVSGLIEVSQSPANHLLKNWAAIQGRDLSPEHETPKARQLKRQLELAYAELEKHFGDQLAMDEKVVAELDELERLVAENMIEDDSKLVEEEEASSTKSSPSKEPPDKRPKLVTDDKENEQPPGITILSIPTQLTRCTSPDLFADSEDEEAMHTPAISISNEPKELNNFSLRVYKNRSPVVEEVEIISSSEEPTQITSYEVFSSSSDEVKTATSVTQESATKENKVVENFIDLTQELGEPNASSLSPKVFSLSAAFEYDSDIDKLNITAALDSCSQKESEPISKEVCLEYATQNKLTTKKEENINEISFSLNRNSFHIGTVTPPSDTKASCSFSELNFSNNSLRRSVSLSSNNSFKYPFNGKMNWSAEKRRSALSPCIHSDVSVDLTQNATQNELTTKKEENINEISFSLDRESDTSKHSFHIGTVTPPSDTKASCSYCELNFSTNSLRRSVSFSSNNSFKCPFNGKMNWSAEKRRSALSPCRHSDVSVDLTQNATQNELTTKKEENINEISFSLDRDSETSKHSFHIGTVTPPSDTKASCSFSELNFSNNSLRRSVSLSSNNIIKCPFNGKMNWSAEKRRSARSPCRHSDVSVDLTQNSNDDNDFILLSDEEINYSIWKANKSTKVAAIFEDESSGNSNCSSPVAKKRALQTEEDLDAFLIASPNTSALSKERAEFGILDAAPSQPFSFSQLQSPSPSTSAINWAEASFLDAPVRPLARRSSHKFNDLLLEHNSDHDFDEFDQLVFQSKKDSTITAPMPSGLDHLLMAEIKVPAAEPAELSAPQDVPEQLEVNGNVYTISVCRKTRPDFASLPESEILQLLYSYGIKPLKRKQAVKMLEFIYNQTHPIMQAVPARPEPIVRSKSTPVLAVKPSSFAKSITEDCLTPTEPRKDFKFNDASGEELLRFSQSLPPSLCDDFEFYVLQTNVSKKTPQPLVPLHIAWHNLLCANPRLHESVLMYEPIDLQEIYLHLKQMGHRYDPKELKAFLDRRCIIFRYELAPPVKQAVPRHVRKMPKKATKRT